MKMGCWDTSHYNMNQRAQTTGLECHFTQVGTLRRRVRMSKREETRKGDDKKIEYGQKCKERK